MTTIKSAAAWLIALAGLGCGTQATAQPAQRMPDGYPSYCVRSYYGTPASSPSYFAVAPDVVLARHLTYDPAYGWCGYPFVPNEVVHPTGYSYSYLARRAARVGYRGDVYRP